MLIKRVLLALVFAVCGLFFLFASFSLWTPIPVMADGATLYVSRSGSCGTKSPCYGTIQSAVDAATDGDIIKIAQGIYTGTGFQVVAVNKAVTLAGGYSIINWTTPDPVNQPTVIDAESAARRRGLYIDSTSPLSVTLTGMTVRNGNTDTNGGGIYIKSGTVCLQNLRVLNNHSIHNSGQGGGLYAEKGSIEISDSVFEGNAVNLGGGGLLVAENATARLTGATFRSNRGYAGAAIWLAASTGTVTIADTLFEDNKGYYGGAVRLERTTAVLADNTFRRNYGYYLAGAVDVIGGSSVIERNLFELNRSDGGSGAISAGGGTIWIRDNEFRQNSAVTAGGIGIGLATVSLARNRFIQNYADSGGGAIGVDAGTTTAENDLLVGNSSPFETVVVNAGSLTVNHWTMVDNGSYAIFANGGTTDLSNSIVISNSVAAFWGSGINATHVLFNGNGVNCGGGAVCSQSIVAAPSFVDLPNGDYHLSLDSPAIDAGIGDSTFTDMDGDPRPVCHGFDLGADEYRPQPPIAGFSAAPVWMGSPTQFQNNSTYTNCESWVWDFGDQTESSQVNPVHIYAVPGFYTTTLAIDNGADSSIITQTIAVYAADFTPSTPGWLGQTTRFTNTSFVQEPTEYIWFFGDGITSTLASPDHVYSQPGSYHVDLSAANSAGAVTVTKPVTIYGPPVVAFGAGVRSGIRPVTVTFTSTVTTTPQGDPTVLYTWDFGDGGTSTVAMPTHVYTASGIYSVSLTVSNFAGTDSQQRVSYIRVYEPVAAGFESTPISGTVPLTVTFTNISSGDFVTSTWDFGDGTVSGETNPTHVYTEPGVFTVRLTVSGEGGTDTLVSSVTVYSLPRVEFAATALSGIRPLSVVFTSTVVITPEVDAPSHYIWDFGDGGTSAVAMPTHVYTASGIYSVSVTVSNFAGTDSQQRVSYIRVYEPVAAGFESTPISGTAPLTVTFTNISSGDFVTSTWDLGDGTVSGETNPTHVYTEPGVYTVRLTVSGEGGTDTLVQRDLILVSWPQSYLYLPMLVR